MLAFNVINLEQHRALQQNAARAHLPEFRHSELSLIARSSSGPKLSKLNRQIQESNRRVTYRKQTIETSSNRQKFQKRLRPFPRPTSSSSPRDLDTPATRKMEPLARKSEAFSLRGCTTSNWPARHLLGGLALSAFCEGFVSQNCISNRFWPKNRSYGKQRSKPRLTGSRFVWLENAFNGNFPMSAAGFLPSCDHMRNYGRS
jgi:hypothetical protein